MNLDKSISGCSIYKFIDDDILHLPLPGGDAALVLLNASDTNDKYIVNIHRSRETYEFSLKKRMGFFI